MTQTAPTNHPRVLGVGPDRVTISEKEVVIEAKHPMPDWDVREINHVPVYVENKKYYLIEKRKAAAPFAARYLLRLWPEYQATNAIGFHTYDAEVVGVREASVRAGHVDDVGRAFLMPLYPVLGLMWSPVQKRLVRFGYVPHVITGFSVFVTFSLVFGQAAFGMILLNSSLRTGKVLIGGFLRALASSDQLSLGPFAISIGLLDILLFVVLIVDTLVRYARYARDDQWAGGFLEWVVPRRKSKAAAGTDGVAPQT